ncbi:MAG TPA: 30S ribosomal protein S8 [Anaerolineales bacterium]|uniref:Small ribosomal subunit protein uS8 n=1 Tax=uncultured Chloroflexi bacterium Rifle_16ft_4_minimus_5762 TaxID=1665077 RepID=A0A0H4T997_9CHLR|nr:30S ribosomal protein S8, small subunit ribosomal protein S8 [uncultured Chloroflexi bacterium Rifle_16ft_4_minimus_5762]HKY79429.1 30S ribosomal protein S8 [Anaerolineales bacterium]
MAVNDPISDMLTRIRNAIMAGQTLVAMPSSKLKSAIAEILKEEGFIESFEVVGDDFTGFKVLRLTMKYIGDRRTRRSVISGLERVSSPGRRIYAKRTEIPWVLSGLGVAILSTPKGVMSGRKARQLGVGGEILCKVW